MQRMVPQEHTVMVSRVRMVPVREMVPQTVTKMVPENFMAPKNITVEKTIQVRMKTIAGWNLLPAVTILPFLKKGRLLVVNI